MTIRHGLSPRIPFLDPPLEIYSLIYGYCSSGLNPLSGTVSFHGPSTLPTFASKNEPFHLHLLSSAKA